MTPRDRAVEAVAAAIRVGGALVEEDLPADAKLAVKYIVDAGLLIVDGSSDELPPFTGPTTCVKCAASVEDYRWRSAPERFLMAHGNGHYLANHTGRQEWMLRECHQCGYCWPEALPERAS